MLAGKKYYFPERFLPLSLHIAAWLALAIIVYNVNPLLKEPGGPLRYYALKILPQLLVFYLNYSLLIPGVLSRLRVYSYLAANFVIITLLSVLATTISGNGLDFQQGHRSPLVLAIINDSLVALLALLIRFAVDWFREKLRKKQRENEALKSELSFLKAQINPHFLFNSLNNLYALVLKQDKKAPEVILGISRIMRYLLYETNEPLVPLANEIDILIAYDTLQQLRDRERQEVIKITGDLSQSQIAPLLLLPLAENLYKHGDPPFHILITMERKRLIFYTENTLKSTVEAGLGGVGSANLKRRLELLYPGRFEFQQVKENNQFKSTLILELDS